MPCKVFISHAVADKKIAAELTRLLASGLEITGKQVFCSSLPGRDIPGGFNFVDHIKKSLAEANIVILLITENYLDSKFCLAEIGASWISKDNSIPVIVRPVGYDKLEATLSTRQALKIDDEDHLDSLADEICKVLGIEVGKAQWGTEKKSFLKRISKLIEEQSLPKSVDPGELEECKGELEYIQNKIQQMEADLKEKNTIIAELEQLKDADQVSDVKKAHLSELDLFESLCNAARKALGELPRVVVDALYYHMKGDVFPMSIHFDDHTWQEVNDAADSRLLFNKEEHPIELNEDHPKVTKAIEPVRCLSVFMQEHDEALADIIEEEYEVTFDLADKNFWEKFLG